MGQYTDLFTEQEISMQQFLRLSKEDLRTLGVVKVCEHSFFSFLSFRVLISHLDGSTPEAGGTYQRRPATGGAATATAKNRSATATSRPPPLTTTATAKRPIF